LFAIYSSLISVVKSRKMKLLGNMYQMGHSINAHAFLQMRIVVT